LTREHVVTSSKAAFESGRVKIHVVTALQVRRSATSDAGTFVSAAPSAEDFLARRATAVAGREMWVVDAGREMWVVDAGREVHFTIIAHKGHGVE
jgi:hypothetical protein